jgi:hypothetical protein
MALDSGEPVPEGKRARLLAISEERDAIAKRLAEPSAKRDRWWRRSVDPERRRDLEHRRRRLEQEEAEIWRALEEPLTADAPELKRRYGRSLSP